MGIVAGEHDVIGTDRELLRLSLGLLTGQDGQPSGGVGVLRPPGDAAVQFVAVRACSSAEVASARASASDSWWIAARSSMLSPSLTAVRPSSYARSRPLSPAAAVT